MLPTRANVDDLATVTAQCTSAAAAAIHVLVCSDIRYVVFVSLYLDGFVGERNGSKLRICAPSKCT